MSDLGLTIAWLAVQVALLLVPALAIQTTAARRGPASGAWVAAVSLGLVLALSAAILVPRSRGNDEAGLKQGAPLRRGMAVADQVSSAARSVPVGPASGNAWALPGLRLAWARLERGAAAPAARFRHWGTSLAVVALAGSGIGLLRLLAGLWAVRLCRRRGAAVDDPGLTALLDELRHAMGCRRWVELREVSELTTPATAGWWRPVVLLPDDWRSWDDSERRAVLAHELAHIIRGDYATGLMARAAVVLHAYHPLVRWMAARLQMQQELAADAFGARFAGGRSRYLVALSRLALRQDGRSPCWPARAFLPPQGTLIRRIAMLRQDTEARDQTWPRSSRVIVGLGLIAIAIGVTMLRGPAWGAGLEPPADQPAATVPAAGTGERDRAEPIELVYIPENAVGVFVFRPAATFRRAGMEKWANMIDASVTRNFESEIVREMRIDPTKPGLPRLKARDIEWVACGMSFGRNGVKEGTKLHTVMFSGFTIRTTQPFDWLKMFNAWGIKTTEVRDGGLVYHRFKERFFGPVFGGAYCPDNRTLVVDNEVRLRALIRPGIKSLPGFVQNAEWRQASRGLLALAINNQNGAYAKAYDLGRPDDAVALSLVKGVDRWIACVADDDAIVLRLAGLCQNPSASEALVRTLESLRKLGQAAIDQSGPEDPTDESWDLPRDMARPFLANFRVERNDRSVDVRARGFGTLADFAAFFASVQPPDDAK